VLRGQAIRNSERRRWSSLEKAWLVGVYAGKESHWAHMLDASGTESLSRRVENDEADLLKLIDDALFHWRKRSSGRWISLEVARRSCWRCYLWERDQRESFTSQASL
jgi:hypothetical protein